MPCASRQASACPRNQPSQRAATRLHAAQKHASAAASGAPAAPGCLCPCALPRTSRPRRKRRPARVAATHQFRSARATRRAKLPGAPRTCGSGSARLSTAAGSSMAWDGRAQLSAAPAGTAQRVSVRARHALVETRDAASLHRPAEPVHSRRRCLHGYSRAVLTQDGAVARSRAHAEAIGTETHRFGAA